MVIVNDLEQHQLGAKVCEQVADVEAVVAGNAG